MDLAHGITWWDDIAILTSALERRGFTAAEITGILGENLLRALDGTWTTP